MGFLLNLFTKNPMVMLYVGLAIAAVSAAAAGSAAWTINGWRLGTQLEHAEAQRDLALAQGKVLAAATVSCTDSVAVAKKASDGATALGVQLLAEARRLSAGNQGTVNRLEDLLKSPAALRADGKPKGCDDAWDEIEKDYAKRAAGRAP